ncbi:glucan biosynthesis protein [Gayadomonas joobiniege]|uniref:glucan biosynthesis protein n=1 Tax=Gayadomonas joobiniege TaxID=1234606 RepID=UPI0003606EA4|nr:glucan biosynthesis protein G [Gayadomonas joobiniege]
MQVKLIYVCLFWLLLVSGQAIAAAQMSVKTPPENLFDVLSARAKNLAAQPYQAVSKIEQAVLNDLDYSAYRAIRFKADTALWAGQKPFEVQFFHPGFLYDQPVKIVRINGRGERFTVPFDPASYQYDGPAAGAGDALKQAGDQIQLGHAGFRVHFPLNNPTYKDEVIVFQGASYFRLVGPGQQYGLSARGLAIDTAEASGEEFPTFTEFWLLEPDEQSNELEIYALLDSPSISGAYHFILQPGVTTEVQVKSQLFAREDINKLGVAPLTSMFLHGENQAHKVDDFRPEVHDSDGLLVLSEQGEWTWRPLTNPNGLRVNALQYENPKGFGLLQRDTEFGHYLDAEAHYGERPGLWVEPTENWGKGHVELVEIPTESETNDNIVAYWVPETPLNKGDSFSFNYRLTTVAGALSQQTLGQVTRTRIGWAALPGMDNPPPQSERQFIVDFNGGALADLPKQLPIQAKLTLSNGSYKDLQVKALPGDAGWRAAFKLTPDEELPADMRLSLHLRNKAITEVWNYVWYASDFEE